MSSGVKTPFVYVRREDSPSGLGIRLDKSIAGEVSIYVTSACCGRTLVRAAMNAWGCDKCGRRSKVSGNGSRVPLSQIHLLGSQWMEGWVSEWTGIPAEDIKVRIRYDE